MHIDVSNTTLYAHMSQEPNVAARFAGMLG
jgi:hypothetical protein